MDNETFQKSRQQRVLTHQYSACKINFGKVYYDVNRYPIGYGNSWLDSAIAKLDDSRISLVEEEYLMLSTESTDYQFGPIWNCYNDYDGTYHDIVSVIQDIIDNQIKEKKDVIELDMQEVVDIINMCNECDEYKISDFKLIRKSNPSTF